MHKKYTILSTFKTCFQESKYRVNRELYFRALPVVFVLLDLFPYYIAMQKQFRVCENDSRSVRKPLKVGGKNFSYSICFSHGQVFVARYIFELFTKDSYFVSVLRAKNRVFHLTNWSNHAAPVSEYHFFSKNTSLFFLIVAIVLVGDSRL